MNCGIVRNISNFHVILSILGTAKKGDVSVPLLEHEWLNRFLASGLAVMLAIVQNGPCSHLILQYYSMVQYVRLKLILGRGGWRGSEQVVVV